MKILKIMGIWALVIVAYVMLALTLSAQKEITTQVSIDLTASANMSNIPGTKQVIDAWPVLVWFIPGGIGGVMTVVFLMKNDQPAY